MPHSVRHTLTCYLTCRAWKEGDLFVAEAVALPVASQGETEGEAMGNLLEALQLFIECCISRGTLEQVLLKHHWRPALRPPRELPRGSFALPVPLPSDFKRQLEACRT